MGSNQFAEIAVGLPIRKTFHYRIPEPLRSVVEVGGRVWVPFGGRRVVGYVVGVDPSPAVAEVKDVLAPMEPGAVLSAELLELSAWIAEQYGCSWGEAIRAAAPVQGAARRQREPVAPVVGPLDWDRAVGLAPSPAQAEAVRVIHEALQQGRHEVVLLHGVTGSGKTEVYLQSMDEALALGRGALLLVPEIALTPQTVSRLTARFGDQVAIFHSRVTPRERYEAWRRVRAGQARIAVGARSAVFGPVHRLGLVVVDEEHATSYKQEEAPRYHAREVAVRRAELAGAVAILGSATPSLEAAYRAERHRYRLIRLGERIAARRLPAVEVVDLRQEPHRRGTAVILSRALERALADTLAAGGQSLLFLNRRGSSTFLQCPRCGHVVTCRRCQVTMTYHLATRALVCHWCHATAAPVERCPECQGGYIRYGGVGTQRVESEVARRFPTARIARMDRDTTRRRGAHDEILRRFEARDVDILIGTQMITAGLDFPGVQLVGVISADTALHLPDFRAGERTFALLTQVAGRAGRGEQPGRVLVQTYLPEHPAIVAAQRHDYDTFYAHELVARRELNLPPVMSLVRLIVRGRREAAVVALAQALAEAMGRAVPSVGGTVVGPAPAPRAKLRGQVRWNLLVKGPALGPLVRLVLEAQDTVPRVPGTMVTVDADPVTLL